jgi:hypothetical protein
MAQLFFSLQDFPNYPAEPFEATSPASGRYNCIAWALEETSRFYWPGPEEFFNWVDDLPRTETLEILARLFQGRGYEVCKNTVLEAGFQKVALFAKDGLPTHAARQLPDGFWTSKLGALEDVRHSLSAISGGLYGEVALVLKRKISWPLPTHPDSNRRPHRLLPPLPLRFRRWRTAP